MWNYGKTPEDGVETHNQPRGFALAFVTFLAPVGRSVGRRRWRGRYARGWVSGADVKLLFGHLSDRGPRRLPVSVKSVRGHRPRRGLLSTFYFILRNNLLYVSLRFPDFFLRAAVWPRLGEFVIRVGRPQGGPTSD